MIYMELLSLRLEPASSDPTHPGAHMLPPATYRAQPVVQTIIRSHPCLYRISNHFPHMTCPGPVPSDPNHPGAHMPPPAIYRAQPIAGTSIHLHPCLYRISNLFPHMKCLGSHKRAPATLSPVPVLIIRYHHHN